MSRCRICSNFRSGKFWVVQFDEKSIVVWNYSYSIKYSIFNLGSRETSVTSWISAGLFSGLNMNKRELKAPSRFYQVVIFIQFLWPSICSIHPEGYIIFYSVDYIDCLAHRYVFANTVWAKWFFEELYKTIPITGHWCIGASPGGPSWTMYQFWVFAICFFRRV